MTPGRIESSRFVFWCAAKALPTSRRCGTWRSCSSIKTICDVSMAAIVAPNHLRTGGLIGTDDVPVLFGVELAGESCGVHQITEQHGELAPFGVRGGQRTR